MRGFKFTGVKLICLYLLCFVVFKNRADAITHLCVKIYIHFLNRCAGKDFLLCTPASIVFETENTKRTNKVVAIKQMATFTFL